MSVFTTEIVDAVVLTGSQFSEPIKDPARFPWHEVKKVEHYRLDVNAPTQPLQLKE